MTFDVKDAMRISPGGIISIRDDTPTVPSITIGNTQLTENMLKLIQVEGMNPLLYEDADPVLGVLFDMADSPMECERFQAVCHKSIPIAKVVTMQNDESERVREVVARILAYEECE